MYRYDGFGADAIYCVEKNGMEISEILFFIDQLRSIKQTGNNIMEVDNLNRSMKKSKLLPKEIEKVIVEAIKNINDSYSKILELVEKEENRKITIDFNLFSYLDLDV